MTTAEIDLPTLPPPPPPPPPPYQNPVIFYFDKTWYYVYKSWILSTNPLPLIALIKCQCRKSTRTCSQFVFGCHINIYRHLVKRVELVIAKYYILLINYHCVLGKEDRDLLMYTIQPYHLKL